MALILSGDINLNPGPAARYQLNDPKFEAFDFCFQKKNLYP